jgi:hypothetical protein
LSPGLGGTPAQMSNSKAPLEHIFTSGPLIPAFARRLPQLGCKCRNRTTGCLITDFRCYAVFGNMEGRGESGLSGNARPSSVRVRRDGGWQSGRGCRGDPTPTRPVKRPAKSRSVPRRWTGLVMLVIDRMNGLLPPGSVPWTVAEDECSVGNRLSRDRQAGAP